jgi:hypothetical protein
MRIDPFFLSVLHQFGQDKSSPQCFGAHCLNLIRVVLKPLFHLYIEKIN